MNMQREEAFPAVVRVTRICVLALSRAVAFDFYFLTTCRCVATDIRFSIN